MESDGCRHRRIVNGDVEQDLSNLPEHAELLVGRAGHGLAQLFQFLLRGPVIFPQALIIEFNSDIGVMHQGLMQKGNQNGIAPDRFSTLEVLRRGFPAQLGEPFDPIGVESAEIPGGDAEPQ